MYKPLSGYYSVPVDELLEDEDEEEEDEEKRVMKSLDVRQFNIT